MKPIIGKSEVPVLKKKVLPTGNTLSYGTLIIYFKLTILS